MGSNGQRESPKAPDAYGNPRSIPMRGLTVMLMAVLLLSGCSFRAPGVSARIGEPDVIHIDAGGGGGGGGQFCPPGHRMKGQC